MSAKKFLMLEHYRKKYGFTQVDMAEVIKKCLSTYSKKESGSLPFYDDEMILIRQAVNERAVKKGDKTLTLDEIFLTT
jgi:DNA-binding XRE family transcriptional regulator